MGRPLKPHGTMAAVRRHRRNHEPLCDLCKQAELENKAERDNERRAKDVAARKAAPVLEAKPAPKLDRMAELKLMYDILGQALQEAPPQSIAAISKERRAILAELTVEEADEAKKGGGLVDELAALKAKKRRTVS